MSKRAAGVFEKAVSCCIAAMMALSLVPAIALADAGNVVFDVVAPDVPATEAEPAPAHEYTYRLLVDVSTGCALREGDVVVGTDGQLALLGFDDADALLDAKAHYEACAPFAVIDGVLDAADDETVDTVESAEAAPPVAPGADALTAVADGADALAPASPERTVALVDTGLAEGPNVDARESVIGDVLDDDNGHGTRMLEAMLSVNPDVRVVSVKALGADGRGSVSGVYAGIEAAARSGAGIVNLSMSAKSTAANAVIAKAVADAHAAGCTVVAAAGNHDEDASLFTPGNIEEVVCVGAVDDAGNIAGSNFGDVVDVYLKAESTSVASALFSARLSLGQQVADIMSEKAEPAATPQPAAPAPDGATDGAADGPQDAGPVQPAPPAEVSAGQQDAGQPQTPAPAGPAEEASAENVEFEHDTDDNISLVVDIGKTEDEEAPEDVASSAEPEVGAFRSSIDYTIRFLPNGGAGAMEDQQVTLHAGFTVRSQLPANAFTREGFDFAGWSTKAPANAEVQIPLPSTIVPDAQALENLGYAGVDDTGAMGFVGLVGYAEGGVIELTACWRDRKTGELDTGQPPADPAFEAQTSSTAYRYLHRTTNSVSRGVLTVNDTNSSVLAYVPRSSSTPIYQCHNPYAPGRYMYTIDATEYNRLGTAGWTKQGIMGYSDDAKGVPVYRYIANNTTDYHDWTTATSLSGYKREGNPGMYGLKWYNVAFAGGGATSGSMSTVRYQYGITYTLPANDFARTGYTFSKWSNGSANKANVTSLTSTSNGTVTLTAQWSANTYTVAYAGMEGASFGSSHPASGTYDANVTITNPTKVGYTFTGWTVSGMDGVTHTVGSQTTTAASWDSETLATTFKNLRSTAGTVTFTAHWEPNTYYVRYNGNGGEGEMGLQEFTYDAPQALALNAFANDANKPFYGWATSSDGPLAYSDGQTVANLTPEQDGVLDLYAQYAGSEHAEDSAITTHANDGSGRTGEVVYRNDIASSANIRSDGTRNGGYPAGLQTVQSYAYENADKVYITADYQTESADASWLAVYGQGVEPSSDNAGMSASGKLGGPAPGEAVLEVEGPAVKAYFNSGSGGDWYGYRVWMRGRVSGSEEPYPSAGGDFAGWNTQPDGGGSAYASVRDCMKGMQPGEAVQLYAMWDLHGKLFYNANGGSGNMPAQAPAQGESEVVVAECSFSLPGYSFAGWNTAADGSGDWRYPGDGIEPGAGAVLYAIWEPSNLVFSCPTVETLVLKADGTIVSASPDGAALENESDFGLKVAGIKASSPARMELVENASGFAEYSLAATPEGGAAQDLSKCRSQDYVEPDNRNDWLIEPGGELMVALEGAMPAIDAVAAGGEPFGEIGWLIGVQSGEVSFSANGGEGELAAQSAALGDALVMPSGAGLSKRYCEFAGWALNPDGAGAVFMPGDTVLVDGDMAFYAVWENVLGFDVESLSWAASTENVLRQALDAHYNPSIDFDITDYIHAGDVRNVSLSTMREASGLERHASQPVQLVVTDATGKYELTDGSGCAALVVQQANALASGTTLEPGPLEVEGGTAAVWADAPRSSWLDTTYKQALPASLRNLVKQVNVAAYDGAGMSDRGCYVFLPAEREVFGGEGALGEAASGLSQWEYYADGGDTVKKAGARGATCPWWLRSAGDAAGEFCNVTATGAPGASPATDALGLAPCFCL